ncbi:UDP-glucose 4-epimerase GalE [Agaribacterium sp. ZY112]|uniref:UDP-glucose 4-epimerase GalE n=1 Tax=Agaribacterium sp. ZY112 TaxID=3233574 RepID=UPI003524ACD0
MNILVTGGAGYIGSHTLVELLNDGHKVVVVDNYSNSSEEPLRRVEKITEKKITRYEVDILDKQALYNVFQQHKFDAVIHFAGLKAVGESAELPLKYYINNISGTLTLCEVMGEMNVKRLVFSSSATVYGEPQRVPIDESFPTSATNPYGRSKLTVEEILHDLGASDDSWNITLLRYFNPVGAHPSGLIGEDPKGTPNNLMPYISQVAVGIRAQLGVFGDDYNTKDGTGVRDYIHVVDLARGHVSAINNKKHKHGVLTLNLGTGNGYSVLDMINTFERISGNKIPYKIIARRPGDVAECYSDPSRAYIQIGWKAKHGLDDMISDGWRWQSQNPRGYC